jgi:hypothetical protein
MLQCEILNSREGNVPHAGQNGKKGKSRIRKKVLYSKLMNIKVDYKIFSNFDSLLCQLQNQEGYAEKDKIMYA